MDKNKIFLSLFVILFSLQISFAGLVNTGNGGSVASSSNTSQINNVNSNYNSPLINEKYNLNRNISYNSSRPIISINDTYFRLYMNLKYKYELLQTKYNILQINYQKFLNNSRKSNISNNSNLNETNITFHNVSSNLGRFNISHRDFPVCRFHIFSFCLLR